MGDHSGALVSDETLQRAWRAEDKVDALEAALRDLVDYFNTQSSFGHHSSLETAIDVLAKLDDERSWEEEE
jgi:hypothetical protein